MLVEQIDMLGGAIQPEFEMASKSIQLQPHWLRFDDYLHELILLNNKEFTPEIWHESRSVAHQKLEDELEAASRASCALDRNMFPIIIVDDNMNYRAMRRKIFSLAHKYCAGFAQIAIDTPRSICVARNEIRPASDKVENSLIHRMVLELPGASSHWWDTHAIVIENATAGSMPDLIDRMPWNTLANCLLAPLPSLPNSELLTYPSTTETPSFLQELDKAIRKEIGKALEVEEMKIHGKALSQAKASFIESIKHCLKERKPLSPDPLDMPSLVDWVTLTFRMEMSCAFPSLSELQKDPKLISS
jgi:tRNA uridine 5-carbamoylmethylation protein Kti12